MRESELVPASHRANVFVYLVCSGSRSRVHIELRYFNDVIYNNRLGNSENLFAVCLFRWFVFWYVSKRFPIINIKITESISIYSAQFQYTFNPKSPPKISIRMSRLWYNHEHWKDKWKSINIYPWWLISGKTSDTQSHTRTHISTLIWCTENKSLFTADAIINRNHKSLSNTDSFQCNSIQHSCPYFPLI